MLPNLLRRREVVDEEEQTALLQSQQGTEWDEETILEEFRTLKWT